MRGVSGGAGCGVRHLLPQDGAHPVAEHEAGAEPLHQRGASLRPAAQQGSAVQCPGMLTSVTLGLQIGEYAELGEVTAADLERDEAEFLRVCEARTRDSGDSSLRVVDVNKKETQVEW